MAASLSAHFAPTPGVSHVESYHEEPARSKVELAAQWAEVSEPCGPCLPCQRYGIVARAACANRALKWLLSPFPPHIAPRRPLAGSPQAEENARCAAQGARALLVALGTNDKDRVTLEKPTSGSL
jgi:hypothetical protein